MTGKRYYITTLGHWQRHAARFANSHFIVLNSRGAADEGAASSAPTTPDRMLPGNATRVSVGARHAVPAEGGGVTPDHATDEDPRILVLIEADEGVHLSLEDESAFEALPHPLAQKPISDAAHAALAPHGVAPGATTFDAAEAVARVHPLLRHRVF